MQMQPATHSSPDTPADVLAAAIQASDSGSIDEAIALFQRCIALEHQNALAHHLLGAELAQMRRHGDAVLHLTTAVEQDPTLWIARLQLGLLWLTLSNPQAATQQLTPMLQLPAEDALRCFAQALLSLAHDDLATAAARLQDGLAIGCDNRALLADMTQLLQRIGNALDSHSAPSAAPAFEASRHSAPSHDAAISLYTGQREGSE